MPNTVITADEIRETFLSYFEARDHLRLPSASLIPAGDPTLLLTTAGMVPFKRYFSGELTPPNRRITTVQKSFRTTDIEEVGDVSHLTLFEMLGNFSFGDYFKLESCEWALDLCLNVFNLEPERIYATIHTIDDEAEQIWLDLGIPPDRISRLGDEDNWWGPAGEEGACGPCSELNYYLGDLSDIPAVGHDSRGKSWGPGISDDFLEFYNLVFTQFNRDRDGNDTMLPSKNIDTGMGFERIVQILQGKSNVYETDVFSPLIDLVATTAGAEYGLNDETDRAIRVVAEHGRSATFLISDGVVPGNTGRGYVLRRVIRRGMLFGRELGIAEPLLPSIANSVAESMSHVYPELGDNLSFTQQVLGQEETSFETTLEQGSRRLNNLIDRAKVSGASEIDAADIVQLYDSHGFPIEMTVEMSANHGLDADSDAIEEELETLRRRSRAAANVFSEDADADALYRSFGVEDVNFLGYRTLSADSEVIGLVVNGESVQEAKAGDSVEVILAETPFYAARGGQIGDTGWLRNDLAVLQVADCQAPFGHMNVHYCTVVSGRVAVGDVLTAAVDGDRREKIRRNHTATHLVHAALREIVGSHVRQSGSLVAPDYLRFDFTHIDSLSPEQVTETQDRVNLAIRQNLPVEVHWTTYSKAVDGGALAFFGDTYEHEVRTIKIDAPWSYELCGGTHMNSTGGIGVFLMVSQSSIGSGIRRIEALTGIGAEQSVAARFELVDKLSSRLRVAPDALLERVDALTEELDLATRRAERLEEQLLRTTVQGDGDSASKHDFDLHLNGNVVPVRVRMVPASNVNAMRRTGDLLRDQIGSGIVILGSVVSERPVVVAMVSKDLASGTLHAGDIAKAVAATIGGGGGGSAETAQAGAKDPSRINEALAKTEQAVNRLYGGRG